MSQEAIWFKLPPPPTAIPGPPPEPATPTIELTIDGSSVNIAQGATILDACRELGVGVTAYGVLSRGLISGHWSADRQGGNHIQADFRAHSPRFSGDNLDRNLPTVSSIGTSGSIRAGR